MFFVDSIHILIRRYYKQIHMIFLLGMVVIPMDIIQYPRIIKQQEVKINSQEVEINTLNDYIDTLERKIDEKLWQFLKEIIKNTFHDMGVVAIIRKVVIIKPIYNRFNATNQRIFKWLESSKKPPFYKKILKKLYSFVQSFSIDYEPSCLNPSNK